MARLSPAVIAQPMMKAAYCSGFLENRTACSTGLILGPLVPQSDVRLLFFCNVHVDAVYCYLLHCVTGWTSDAEW